MINTTSEDPRENLATLAAYLEALPKDYKEFEMATFLEGDTYDNREAIQDYLLANGGVASCGTSACAVGHGPAAGLFFNESEICLDYDNELVPRWTTYARRVFGAASICEAFDFLFGGTWSYRDNTVHGAAARIRYYLAEGLPVDRCNPEVYTKYRVV